MWASPAAAAAAEQLSLLNSSRSAAESLRRDRKGERAAEEWRDEEQEKGEAIFRQLRVYHCQRKGRWGGGGIFRCPQRGLRQTPAAVLMSLQPPASRL